MKNVLHIANYKAVYKGNFIESLRLLSGTLRQQNIQTFYCFPMVGENSEAKVWMDELRDDGYKVFNFFNKIFEDAELFRRIIKQHDISIVHVHFFTMEQILSVKIATLGTKVKIIMHFHNHSVPANGLKSFFRQRLYANTTMISCSESVLTAMERDYPKNVKYNVDNGVNFERLKFYGDIARSEYDLKNDSKLILMFGFDYYRKGVDVAINAVKALNRNNNEYELIISLSKNAQSVKDKIIEAHGEVPPYVKIIAARNDVASLYNFCDVFISPSREEGLPYSVIEAAYCDCSVVISDIAPQQCLERIPYIVYHKTEDAESLEKAIETALFKQNERRINLEDIRRFLYENYSLEKWAKSMDDIYNKVCESNNE